MYSDTITLFNYIKPTERGGLGSWQKTVIPSVEVQSNTASTRSTNGTTNTDSVLLMLHHSGGYIAVDGGDSVKWYAPKAWSALEDKTGTVTFSPGDFFVLGDMGNETVSDSEKPNLFDQLNRANDNVWRITKYADYKLPQHIEVYGV